MSKCSGPLCTCYGGDKCLYDDHIIVGGDADECRLADEKIGHANHIHETPDMVNQPPHYTQGGIECIDAIRAAVTGKPPYEAWLTGQVIKYIWRYNFKNGKEDLEKAEFYLKRLIEQQ